MNEEPKEEKKKTLGEINAEAACLELGWDWDAGAAAVQAEVLKEVQREIIADVASRAGMAALHVDKLKPLMEPLLSALNVDKQRACTIQLDCNNYCPGEVKLEWHAYIDLPLVGHCPIAPTPEEAVAMALRRVEETGQANTPANLQRTINHKKQELQNLEEQLAKLDGFAAPAEAEAIGGAR